MIEDVNVIDVFFVPYSKLGNVVHWVQEIFSGLKHQIQSAMDLIEVNLWIVQFLTTSNTDSGYEDHQETHARGMGIWMFTIQLI